MIERILKFLENVLRPPAGDKTPWRFRLLKPLRVAVLCAQRFREDACVLRASALTYYTLMSIVPVLAISFGIAKGFGLEDVLDERIRNSIQVNKEVVTQALQFAKQLLANAQGGLVAGIGLLVLFWSAIKLLSNVEEAFNAIWRVDRQRPFMQKVSHYLSFVFLSPILLVLSGSLSVYVAGKITSVLESLSFLGFLTPVAGFAFGLAPFALLWFLFAFTYGFLPNTRVSLRHALVAGIVFGTLCGVVQKAYISLQVGVTRLNAIYGSFAALPLFLTWLQMTWSVVLLGGEYCHCLEHTDACAWTQWGRRPSATYRRLLSLAIVRCCVKRFCEKTTPPRLNEIIEEVRAPSALVLENVERLARAGVLSRVSIEEDEESFGYQPAWSVDSLTIAAVIEALDRQAQDDPPIAETEDIARLAEHLKKLEDAWKDLPDNALVRDA